MRRHGSVLCPAGHSRRRGPVARGRARGAAAPERPRISATPHLIAPIPSTWCRGTPITIPIPIAGTELPRERPRALGAGDLHITVRRTWLVGLGRSGSAPSRCCSRTVPSSARPRPQARSRQRQRRPRHGPAATQSSRIPPWLAPDRCPGSPPAEHRSRRRRGSGCPTTTCGSFGRRRSWRKMNIFACFQRHASVVGWADHLVSMHEHQLAPGGGRIAPGDTVHGSGRFRRRTAASA